MIIGRASVRRLIGLFFASLLACNVRMTQAVLDASIVPSRFLTARSGVGTDPLFLFYFPECVGSVSPYVDSISPPVIGTLSSPTTPVCPSNSGFTNSNNGVIVDGTRSPSLSGFVSSAELTGPIADFSLEMWVRTDSALDVTNANYVLFEIGESVPGGSGFAWGCSTEYIARLFYSQVGFLRFEFEDLNAVACGTTVVTAAFTFTPGQLYHIVVTVADGGASTLYIDGSSAATGGGGTGGLDFAATTAEFVYIGDSPGALSTAGNVFIHPWDGEILLVSFYDITLTSTNIGNLRTSGFLPNHRPAVKSSSRTGQEDANLTITFTNLVDYYDEDEKSSTVTTPIQFIVESTPSSGFLFDDTGLISVSGGAHTVVGTLQYGQSVPNIFNFTDSFTYSVDDQIATKTAPATMNLFIGATNDVPVAEDVTISTPAFQINDVVFQGSDNNDCPGSTCEEGFFPQSMQVQVVGNSFGQLKRVGGGSDCTEPLGADITNGEIFTLDAQGQFLACYEAAGDDTINSNGIVGVDTITYVASDAFETSSSGTVTVTVTSVLSVANLLTHVQNEDEVVEFEGNATGGALSKTYAIELVGVDNKCDDVDVTGTIVTPKVGVLGCPRQKEYVISPPLPSFGTLLVDDDGTLKAITDADLVAEGFYLIPGNGSKVLFLPDENFFNAAPHPLCKPSLTGSDTQISRCAVGGPYSGPSCVGPFCGDGTPFSTLSFNGSFGFCNKTECPAELHYRLKIGLAISEEDADPDIQIFVKSEFDRNPLIFEPSRSLTPTGLGFPRFDTPIRTDNGDPMRLDALDQDQRIVGCQFLIAGVGDEAKIRIANSLLTARPEDDDFQYDSCFFQGCDKTDSAEIFTFPSRMNEVLEALEYSHVSTATNLEESVSVIIRDRYLFTAVAPDAANYLLIFVINFSSGGGGGGNIFSDIQFIAIASSVGLLILMCLISYCGCLGTRARNMTRSCLQVQSLLKRDNEVPHSELEYRKSLRQDKDLQGVLSEAMHAAKKRTASERFAASMLKFAACLCPCCCSYDPSKLHLPTEEGLERRVIDGMAGKLARPPRDEDETHLIDEEHFDDWMLVYDDEGHPFWWNKKSGKSQWYSPFPEGSHMAKVLEDRFKKEGAKPHKQKKVKKSKSKKNNRPPPGRPKGPPPKAPQSSRQKKFSPAPPKMPKKLDR